MLVSDLKEKDLHPFFVKWGFDTWQIACKTIDQSKSKNKNKGENEWVHPDIVGVRFMKSQGGREGFSSTVETLYQQSLNDVEFYSFELKCSVTLSTLKQYYFQAVSNSTWANYGYLVTAELDIYNSILMEELGRLVNSFGIGVILLNPGRMSQSQVVFESKKRSQLDFYTMDKIAHKIENTDFKNFLAGVNSCITSKEDVVAKSSILTNEKHFDPILGWDELLNGLELTMPPLTNEVPIKEIKVEEVAPSEEVSKALVFQSIQSQVPEAYTHTQPAAFRIKSQEFEFATWKDLLREFCLFLREDDPLLFQQHCYPTEDFSATLFFNDVSDKWVARKIKKGKQIELEEGLFVVCDLNAKAVVTMVQQLMRTFDLPDIWVTIGS